MALPLPRKDTLDRLGVAGREIAAIAKQALLLRHDLAAAVPREVAQNDDVVVCLHGIFATAGVMRPLRERLERHGDDGWRLHTATMTYEPGPGIDTLARRLAEIVASLPLGVRVHLVGHSLGGVVVRWFAQEIGDPRLVQTISLAAPFAGVRSLGAKVGLAVAKDLDPQSPLLRKLRLGSTRALALPHLSLVAEHDHMVDTPMAHVLPGGDVTLIRKCGHNALLYHEEAAALVERRVLEHARPTW